MKRAVPKCRRCGKCCESSSPTLHLSDLPLVKKNLIELAFLYTIRQGEHVWDSVEKRNTKASQELIKVKETPEGCFFYDSEKKACRIYEHRPVQCRALFCEDTTEFFRVYKTPSLARKDIVRDPSINKLIDEHDRRCSFGRLEEWLSKIETLGEKAVEEVIKILRFDYELRELVTRKLDVSRDHLDFLFGRPMIKTIRYYGLEVRKQEDGSFLLTTR
ncbi:MAG: hypothetical protein DRH12_10045 [Deltaproteobacteria bacterium]|nr:MAG: hypothetical protein DRH12_10045 [Deltaproteobacteria bacterium]